MLLMIDSKLHSHLYSYFGILLGCSKVGKDGFPAYSGESSQIKVHKYDFPHVSKSTLHMLKVTNRFMNLNAHQIGYFISQVGLSASSFGVSKDDIASVATALAEAFDVKCAPPTIIDSSQGPQLQSICLADDCPEAPKGDCAPYGTSAGEPLVANETLAMGEGKKGTDTNGTTKSTDSKGSPSGPKPTKASGKSVGNVMAVEMWLTVAVGIVTLLAFAL